MPSYKKGIGYRYIQETKYHLGTPLSDNLGPIERPSLFKTYPDAIKISLPEPNLISGASIWECLGRRRSLRDYKPLPISLEELSSLLWATQGITVESPPFFYRTAPSAGALYPIETYLWVNRVNGVEKGIYHFNVKDFELEQIAKGDLFREITKASLGQVTVMIAAIVFIWTAIVLRSMWKYRNRAIRYIFMDVGHICENLQLAATALNLGSCPIGAFYDDEINRLIELDGEEETTIYLATVGKI
ncbi:MAG TPA: SagB/ThcOx family dehydrogenase [Syntrophaceae bacterium]|nr:SagB/ThcOx family dehydrogenase [Syntrophaceae bacterium]